MLSSLKFEAARLFGWLRCGLQTNLSEEANATLRATLKKGRLRPCSDEAPSELQAIGSTASATTSVDADAGVAAGGSPTAGGSPAAGGCAAACRQGRCDAAAAAAS